MFHRTLILGLTNLAIALLACVPAFADDPASGGFGPSDPEAVSPAKIRERYFKRFKFAKQAAIRDTENEQETPAGPTKEYSAYSQVKQYCVGGFLGIFNKLDDTLSGQNQALTDFVKNNVPEGSCREETLGQLTKQMQDIQNLNRQDLSAQLPQQNVMQQINPPACSGLADNPLYLALKKTQDKLNQIKGKLNSLPGVAAGTESLDTDDKVCCFFDASCKGDLGSTIHYFYVQDQQQGKVELPSKRDEEIFDNQVTTYGYPCSDTQFQVIDRVNKQRMLEMIFDPQRWMWTQTNTNHLQTSSMANSVGAAAESSFKAAFKEINTVLFNVANEEATAGSADGTAKAVKIVQGMYKTVFVPIAILLLLPGAVLTQVKGMVSFSMLGGGEDSTTPFDGILRSMIAIFLIPATQLIVSYAIDVGNTMAFEVRNPAKQWISESELMKWAKEQTFHPPPGNVANAILDPKASAGEKGPGSSGSSPGSGPSSGGADPSSGPSGGSGGGAGGSVDVNVFGDSAAGQIANDILNSIIGAILNAVGEGKAAGLLAEQTTNEEQIFLSSTMQLGFNSIAYVFGAVLEIMSAFQLVLMCYLFCLGPIAACFFAWPSGMGKLFRQVFSNWVDAVVVLSLWRFYWCVILAVMTQRLVHLHPNPASPLEMVIFNCFLALLLYIPFQPFNFRPGDVAGQILQQAGSGGGGGGGGGGGHAPSASPGKSAPGTESTSSHTDSTTQSKSGFATQDFQQISMGSHSNVHSEGSMTPTDSGDKSGSSQPSAAPPPTSAPLPSVEGQIGEAPQTQGASDPVAQSLAQQFGAENVSSLPAGSPPIVPLTAPTPGSGTSFAVAPGSTQSQAAASMQNWLSHAPNLQSQGVSPGASLSGAPQGAPPMSGGAPPTGSPPAGSPPISSPPASSAPSSGSASSTPSVSPTGLAGTAPSSGAGNQQTGQAKPGISSTPPSGADDKSGQKPQTDKSLDVNPPPSPSQNKGEGEPPITPPPPS